jgi:hypothetical protein
MNPKPSRSSALIHVVRHLLGNMYGQYPHVCDCLVHDEGKRVCFEEDRKIQHLSLGSAVKVRSANRCCHDGITPME